MCSLSDRKCPFLHLGNVTIQTCHFGDIHESSSGQLQRSMMDPSYRILWLSTIGNTLETPAFAHPIFQRWIGMAETSKASTIPWYDFASKSHTEKLASLYSTQMCLQVSAVPRPAVAALLSAPTNKSDTMPESISYTSNPVSGNLNIKMA
jgi:hypothetical protein